jgi:hypothetical protein
MGALISVTRGRLEPNANPERPSTVRFLIHSAGRKRPRSCRCKCYMRPSRRPPACRSRRQVATLAEPSVRVEIEAIVHIGAGMRCTALCPGLRPVLIAC